MDASWDAAIRDWDTAAHGAGMMPATRRLRCYYLRRFAAWLPPGTGPWQVSGDLVLGWLADGDWSPETRKSARASLRVFYTWALESDRTATDPMLRVRGIRVPSGAPRPAPEQVLAAALLRSDQRVRLMLLLAAYGGLRRAEIAQLRASDLVDGRAWVHGKGGVVRVVPLHRRIRAHLEQHPPPGGWMFPAPDGGHLSPDRVGRLMSAALGPGWTAHTLRHRFATQVYAAGHDVLQTQGLLGHASPKTTQRYVRLPDGGAAAAVDAIV